MKEIHTDYFEKIYNDTISDFYIKLFNDLNNEFSGKYFYLKADDLEARGKILSIQIIEETWDRASKRLRISFIGRGIQHEVSISFSSVIEFYCSEVEDEIRIVSEVGGRD